VPALLDADSVHIDTPHLSSPAAALDAQVPRGLRGERLGLRVGIAERRRVVDGLRVGPLRTVVGDPHDEVERVRLLPRDLDLVERGDRAEVDLDPLIVLVRRGPARRVVAVDGVGGRAAVVRRGGGGPVQGQVDGRRGAVDDGQPPHRHAPLGGALAALDADVASLLRADVDDLPGSAAAGRHDERGRRGRRHDDRLVVVVAELADAEAGGARVAGSASGRRGDAQLVQRRSPYPFGHHSFGLRTVCGARSTSTC